MAMEYWATALRPTQYVFRPYNMQVNKMGHKVIRKELRDISKATGHEIDCDPNITGRSHLFVLDVDYSDKSAQKGRVVWTPEVASFANAHKELYIEESVNKGMHILIRCADPVYICSSRIRLDTPKGADPRKTAPEHSGCFVFEFKLKCMLWPSQGYVPRNKPTQIAALPFSTVLRLLSELFRCLDTTNSLEEPFWRNAIQDTATDSIGSMIPEPADEDATERELDRLYRDEYEQPRPEDEVAPNDDNNDDLLSEYSHQQQSVHSIAAAPVVAESSGGGRRKRKTAKDSSFDTQIKRIALNALTEMRGQGIPLSNDIDEAYNQESMQPSDFLVNKKYEQKISEITEAIRKLSEEYDHVKASFVTNLTDIIRKFHLNYITKKAADEKGRIFGENVKMFLQYMLRVDTHLTSWESVLDEGVYSRLEQTGVWTKWLFSYCQLVIFLEQLQDANGKHSRISKFDDYAVYREITRRNRTGHRLSEEAAYQEYQMRRTLVAQKISLNYENCWYKFESFVLTTIASIRIYNNSISAFGTYVDYICSPAQELDLYVDLLLKVILTSYSFKISFISEEVEFDRYDPTAAIYFHNYPWLLSSSDMFKRFISNNFPNLSTVRGAQPGVDQLIKYLNSQDRRIENANHGPFKRWHNQLPFANGLFDFNFLKRAIDEIDQRALSKGGKNIMESIPSYGGLPQSAHDIQNYETVNKRLLADNNLRVTLRTLHKLEFSKEDLERYASFSVFRNYSEHDSVLTPIESAFKIEDYIDNFERTHDPMAIGSIENHLLNLTHKSSSIRYSDEFCAYMRCLLGADAKDGEMGPFQYVRLLTLVIFFAQALMRTKIFQVSLNIVGRGSNGKSQFIEIMRDMLGNQKMVYTIAKSFFANGETNQMKAGLDEEAFIIYDIEANDVDMASFKTFVTDAVPALSRKLYKNIDSNKQNFASVVLCSNTPLRYTNNQKYEHDKYDAAFHRRVVVFPFYNLLGADDRCGVTTGEPSRDSLFKTLNYDLKHPNTIKRIREGLFVYLIDTIHVFGLSSLSATNNDYIVPSLANQRLIGHSNYVFLQAIRDNFAITDEIFARREDAERASGPTVDLAKFFSENSKTRHAMNSTSLDDVCELLTKTFGITIDKRDPSLDNLSEDYTTPSSGGRNPLWASEIGRYMAYGLVAKSSLADAQLKRYKCPNILHQPGFDAQGKNVKDLTNAELDAFVNGNIPIGHRFFFNKMQRKIHEAVFCLCSNQPIQPLQKPVKHSNWTSCLLKDLVDNKKMC